MIDDPKFRKVRKEVQILKIVLLFLVQILMKSTHKFANYQDAFEKSDQLFHEYVSFHRQYWPLFSIIQSPQVYSRIKKNVWATESKIAPNIFIHTRSYQEETLKNVKLTSVKHTHNKITKKFLLQ